MKKLWYLLPFATFYPIFYIGFTYLPKTMDEVWWGVPLFFTLIGLSLASFLIGIFYSD